MTVAGTSRAGIAEALDRGLRELRRIELELAADAGSRGQPGFGDPRAGAEVAAALGYGPIRDEDARVVDSLRWLPQGVELIRAYLGRVAAP